MKKVRFICRDCGYIFTADVFEPGEAEEKRLPIGPIRCQRCRSTSVERH